MRHSGKAALKQMTGSLMGGNEIGAVSTGVDQLKVAGVTAPGAGMANWK